MKRGGHSDFAVSGDIDPSGFSLDPDLLHLEGVKLMVGHAAYERPQSHEHKVSATGTGCHAHP